jgi:hypothetical protein
MFYPELLPLGFFGYSGTFSAYKLPQPDGGVMVGGYLSDDFLAPWLLLFF